MAFDRSLATRRARKLSAAELEAASQTIRSAINHEQFAGVETLDEVRQLIEILVHEQHRREALALIDSDAQALPRE
jgi:hypothetical protein